MKRPATILSILLHCLFFISCATRTNTQKKQQLVGYSFASGALLGAVTAPKDEKQEIHAIYWGSILGLTAALVGDYFYNDQNEIQNKMTENQKLKDELEFLQKSQKILIDQGQGKFKNPTEDISLKGKRAQWKVYDINKWVKDGANKLYHQDKLIEVIPLELNTPETAPNP